MSFYTQKELDLIAFLFIVFSPPLLATLIILNTASANEINDTKIVETGVIAKIHDGDTVTISVTREFNVRLIDCWAPEITGKEKELGLKSKAGLESMVKIGDQVRVEIPTEKNQPKITLGRTLARIYKDINNDGVEEDISTEMVKRGLATNKK